MDAPLVRPTSVPFLLPAITLSILSFALLNIRRTRLTALFTFISIIFLASLIVGIIGTFVFFLIFMTAWILLHPSKLNKLMTGRRVGRPKTAIVEWMTAILGWMATIVGWIAIIYDTIVVFACVVSWIVRQPPAFAVAKKLGYGCTTSIALGGSVVAMWGLWCLVGVGWDMGMGMEVIYDSEENGDKDGMVLPK